MSMPTKERLMSLIYLADYFWYVGSSIFLCILYLITLLNSHQGLCFYFSISKKKVYLTSHDINIISFSHIFFSCFIALVLPYRTVISKSDGINQLFLWLSFRLDLILSRAGLLSFFPLYLHGFHTQKQAFSKG